MFDSVLVANRGEIAIRVMKTLHRLGIRPVAVYTAEDAGAAHVGRAEQAIQIGSYLDAEAVVGAAVSAGARALHPGYGFLSEKPQLARACAKAGVVFIGPPPEAIEIMGDKINAKQTVAAAGVPVVPGRDEPGLDDATLAEAALEIGLPVLLKPSAGGGGKGMRLVDRPEDLAGAIESARREARGAFGDDTLLVERFVVNPRHIEMQVFADSFGTTVALGERECSLQRRHQKIIEEAPSPLLDESVRRRMADSAVATAKACGYVGAGTVEFIVSGDRPDEFFFMEMNTRLQVEHPVTEMVLGLDLVELQIRVAAGERLPWDSGGVPVPRGHAVEARVYAEDPSRGFLPASGPVLALAEPGGDGIRVDSALEVGGEVGTSYDPMVSKVVAWGPDRPAALSRLRQALAGTGVLGFATNTGFLRRLLAHPDVVAGDLDTGLVERHLADLVAVEMPEDAAIVAALIERGQDRPGDGPWERTDGWRMAGPAPHVTRWTRPEASTGEPIEVRLTGSNAEVGSAQALEVCLHDFAPSGPGSGWATVRVGARVRRVLHARDGDDVWVFLDGDVWRLRAERDTIDRLGAAQAGHGRVTSPMPGKVLAVHVQTGSEVASGTPLVTVEAMKMEHVVAAPLAGTVVELPVRAGDPVKLEQLLAVVEA